MKVAYIVPGTGESFYCGNCMRDSSYIKAFRKTGHDIITIPMYLPLTLEKENNIETAPIFYGAVNLYLKQLSPIFKKMPTWFSKLLDSRPVLKYVAKKAGSTRAVGLEKMTISMLNGEHGNQANDLDVLINWLRKNFKPDVIHLSNALLLGMAPKLKRELNAAIICSLQDEDEWLDEMREPWQTEAWNKILENAAYTDAFVSVSYYFKNLILSKIKLSENKIHVVYNSVDPQFYNFSNSSKKEHVIGYLSRINEAYGLEILIDALIILKKEKQFSNLKIKISGGFTDDDKKYINKIKSKITKENLQSYVYFHDDFSEAGKKDFFKSISIFSVPAKRKEAFGMHLLEALASGIPVIQPDHGAYSEIINTTNAGLLFEPNSPQKLATSLREIITNDELYETLKQNCKNGIETQFNSKKQVAELLKIYENSIINKSQ